MFESENIKGMLQKDNDAKHHSNIVANINYRFKQKTLHVRGFAALYVFSELFN